MHTAEELDRTDFEYRSGDQIVSRSDVMPRIALHDRLGVVMDAGIDGIGAGNFLLSCVTEFYDRLRELKADFFEYPDYYTFQTTAAAADYMMLDVYPAHKNVTVEADAEQLLRAINDRAINILLVPDAPSQIPETEEITRRSAERRVDHCYLYAPDGRLEEAAFSIQLPRHPAEEWYTETAQSIGTSSETNTDLSVGPDENHIIQGYKRIPLDRALSHLPAD